MPRLLQAWNQVERRAPRLENGDSIIVHVRRLFEQADLEGLRQLQMSLPILVCKSKAANSADPNADSLSVRSKVTLLLGL